MSRARRRRPSCAASPTPPRSRVKNGIEPHAGHGLTFDNVAPVAAIPQLAELNIGHFLVGEAIFTGFEASVAADARADGRGAGMEQSFPSFQRKLESVPAGAGHETNDALHFRWDDEPARVFS